MTTDPVDGRRERYAEGLARLLDPGEQLRALAQAREGMGAGPADPQPPQPPADGGGPGFLGVVLNVLGPIITFGRLDDAVTRLFFGVSGRGGPGSAASLLRHALTVGKVTDLRESVLAVTDKRLLLATTGRMTLTSGAAADDRARSDLEVRFALPRAAVAGARVGWYRLNPRRLRIDFTDGSWLAFTVPLGESARPLREVASALSG
ncbi:hypothetical protein [Micromonospora sp. NPDC126480]|uniref:hypothetical protein n=1 Tax=Micromonospora sp. NPDC126480 TaxID=3155312 RepID=UPI00332BB4D4